MIASTTDTIKDDQGFEQTLAHFRSSRSITASSFRTLKVESKDRAIRLVSLPFFLSFFLESARGVSQVRHLHPGIGSYLHL